MLLVTSDKIINIPRYCKENLHTRLCVRLSSKFLVSSKLCVELLNHSVVYKVFLDDNNIRY